MRPLMEWYEDYYAALKAASFTNSGGSYDSGVGYIGTGSFVWPMPGYTYITCYYGDGGHRPASTLRAGGIYGGHRCGRRRQSSFTAIGWTATATACSIDHGNGYS